MAREKQTCVNVRAIGNAVARKTSVACAHKRAHSVGTRRDVHGEAVVRFERTFRHVRTHQPVARVACATRASAAIGVIQRRRGLVGACGCGDARITGARVDIGANDTRPREPNVAGAQK